MDTRQANMDLVKVKLKKIKTAFEQPEITSVAGALLVGKGDGVLSPARKLAAVIKNKSGRDKIEHKVENILRQRFSQICLGYPDADDCDHFRYDPAFKTAAGQLPSGPALVSLPTLKRLENSAYCKDLLCLANVFSNLFIQSCDASPEAVIIDLDPTVDLCHGMQEMSLCLERQALSHAAARLHRGVRGDFRVMLAWRASVPRKYVTGVLCPKTAGLRRCAARNGKTTHVVSFFAVSHSSDNPRKCFIN